MYVAQYEGADRRFSTIAVEWDGSRGSGPGAWAGALGRHPEVDAALRFRPRRPDTPALLILSADRPHQAALSACLSDLQDALGAASLAVARDAAAFDALLAAPPSHQVRVQYRGYHHGGAELACDFRLYASLGEVDAQVDAVYQVNLAAHRPDAECERQVRKHLARLDLERPFTDAVRAMQTALAQRLLQPGWIGDEYLAFGDDGALDRWSQAVARRFAQTTGRVGFAEPPLESGDFHDWFATGCPTLRDASEPDSLMRRAAACFDAAELDWLLCAPLAGAADGSALALPSEGDHVFISYASPDFAAATALCRHLEAAGRRCWIAPRDIERTLLPYTEAIAQAIAGAAAVAVLLSEPANRSVHIPREIDLALERRCPVVPVRLQRVLPTGQLDYLLRTCQWLDAFERDEGAVTGELLQRLASAGT